MKKNSYGLKSMICLGLSLLCFSIYYLLFMFNGIEIIYGILFYAAIILEIISLIFGVIGISKDKNKLLSILGVIIFLLIVFAIIYYINVILPKEIDIVVSGWLSSWGISR